MIEFVSDILDICRIGGNSVIVVEAILFIKSLVSDVAFVVSVVKELRRIGGGIDVTELFFVDIRDDFRRLIVATAMGVVFVRVNFRCESGVDEADVRVNRRVNKRSGCFVGLIGRIVAMFEI